MAGKSTGQVLYKQRKRGGVYALRFRAAGRRRYLTLGTRAEGWTRARAEEELANVLADVRRGLWSAPVEDHIADEGQEEPSFHKFASEWFDAAQLDLRRNTVAAYRWEITHHLLPFFAEYLLSQITVEEVDRYRTAKVRDRDALIQERAANDQLPKTQRETLPRPLSNETINKTIKRLAQILEVAVEYGHIDRNPATGKRRRLKVTAPTRSYLDRATQIEALLGAAGDLDHEARAGDLRNRRMIVTTLVLSGLRIGELLDLTWTDVDLAAGRLIVGRAKTDAGVREIPLLPALREDLVVWKLRSKHSGLAELVFTTKTGGPQSASNVRNRILTPAAAAATAALVKADGMPLPDKITPHSLRRTFASLLFSLGHTAPEVMAQLGHTDPKVTLGIYARAMGREEGEDARLRALAGTAERAQAGTDKQNAPQGAASLDRSAVREPRPGAASP